MTKDKRKCKLQIHFTKEFSNSRFRILKEKLKWRNRFNRQRQFRLEILFYHFLSVFLYLPLSVAVIVIDSTFIYLIRWSKRILSSDSDLCFNFRVLLVEFTCKTFTVCSDNQSSNSNLFRKLWLGSKMISVSESSVSTWEFFKINVSMSWFIFLNRDPSQL